MPETVGEGKRSAALGARPISLLHLSTAVTLASQELLQCSSNLPSSGSRLKSV